MRITMINDDLSQEDAAIALRIRVALPEPVEAAYWHKLLTLVEHLQSGPPDCDVDSFIVFRELILSKPFPPDPERDREFEKFITEWQKAHPDPSTWSDHVVDAVRPFFSQRRDSIAVTVDWPDYGPVENGIPVMHYRFRIHCADKAVTEDSRATDLLSAKKVICRALGL